MTPCFNPDVHLSQRFRIWSCHDTAATGSWRHCNHEARSRIKKNIDEYWLSVLSHAFLKTIILPWNDYSCRTDQLNCARAVLLYVNMTCWTCHYHIPSHCAAQHKSLYIRYKGFTLAHVANHTCSCMWLGRVIALRSMDRRAHGHWHWIFIFYCYVLVRAITFANQDALIHPIRA